jgi:hypothetical protein
MSRVRIEALSKLEGSTTLSTHRTLYLHAAFVFDPYDVSDRCIHRVFPIVTYSVSNSFIQRFCIYCFIQLLIPRLPSEVYHYL